MPIADGSGSGGESTLRSAIAWGLRVVAGLRRFGTTLADDTLGRIELPPLTGTPLDTAALKVTAPLYLAAELERAGLLPAMETLSALYMSGAIPADLGESSVGIVEFWRRRHDRFSAAERQAMFSRLFGGPFPSTVAVHGGRNDRFERSMIQLAEALYEIGTQAHSMDSGDIHLQSRLRIVARGLGADLSSRSGGMAAFAAGEILEDIRSALEVMKDVRLQRAFSALSVWSLVENIHVRYGGTLPNVLAHVSRAQSGQLILAWLSDSVSVLSPSRGKVVAAEHPVVGAATQWLQATSSLMEPSSVLAG